VGLYLPTQMIGGGRVETVTTEAVAAAAGGDRRLIGLLACLQLLLPFVAFTLARVVPAALFRHRRGMRPARVAA
jgi:putative thiamine transport system permease protein